MRIVVIGGGVTGLAAAHRLTELAHQHGRELDVRLFEASERLGGIIGTVRRDGYVLELGPDSMITDKPAGLALARRLGLQDELIGTNNENRRSFVVRAGQLMPVPEGFQLLAPTRFDTLAESPIFSWEGKCRLLEELSIPPRTDGEDESLGDFVLRRLGREALERMAQPMIAGIYGADPMKLSLRATLPRFLDMEREYGSVIRGMWERAKKAQNAPSKAAGEAPPTSPVLGGPAGASLEAAPSDQRGVSGARYGLFVSFRNGMQTLTDALAERLPEGAVNLGTPVQHLERSAGGWRLTLPDAQQLDADAVILALPAYRSAELIRNLDGELARLLDGIVYAASATMTLCYRRDEVPHPLDGFGFVVPEIEGLTVLGCTFTDRKWAHRAPEGRVLLRAFLGDKALEGRNEAELEQIVRADLQKLVGVTAEPEFVLTWRGARAMPHYYVGHLDRVAEMESRTASLGNLALAGNAYRGVGIPDSILSGERAAEAMFQAVSADPCS